MLIDLKVDSYGSALFAELLGISLEIFLTSTARSTLPLLVLNSNTTTIEAIVKAKEETVPGLLVYQAADILTELCSQNTTKELKKGAEIFYRLLNSGCENSSDPNQISIQIGKLMEMSAGLIYYQLIVKVGSEADRSRGPRGTCLAGWKATLPVDKVHASPAGRQPFQSTRYMPRRLEGPCRLEGNPSSRPLVSGIPGDTRISAGIWGGGEGTSAPESARDGGYLLSPGGYPPASADTRQGIRIGVWMCPFPRNLGGYPGIPKDTRGQKGGCPAGRVSFQPVRCMYLAGWKEILPVDEVHVPCRPFKGRVSEDTRSDTR
ncbi:serine/threonine-protein kinase M1 [Puccinia graminis f. sp. tritici]|uniref:Serine/threonine-protein kinase M1 n=2 Tax=Puccinia graminis f. sp. tritici TaxID=56615 RepID=A0A5B0MBW8_PUCGR|nr:serine/threonine-protein kinase M1 [Puccinia graminis f. sp. tritici]